MPELFEALPEQVSLPRQIQAALREVKQREYVYPRRVDAGKMTQAKADEEIGAMKAIARTLETHAKLREFVEMIARLTPPRGDCEDDEATLQRLIADARALTEGPGQ